MPEVQDYGSWTPLPWFVNDVVARLKSDDLAAWLVQRSREARGDNCDEYTALIIKACNDLDRSLNLTQKLNVVAAVRTRLLAEAAIMVKASELKVARAYSLRFVDLADFIEAVVSKLKDEDLAAWETQARKEVAGGDCREYSQRIIKVIRELDATLDPWQVTGALIAIRRNLLSEGKRRAQ
jgi:hypothetical protein